MFNNAIKLNNANEFTMEGASSSPFAVYADEISVHEKRYSLPATPTEVDKAILQIINKTMFSTSAILIVQLKNMGVDVDITNVKNRLRRLSEAEFLAAYRFKLPDGGKSSHLAYRLGWRGAGYLKANGMQPRMTTYLAGISEDATAVKKILSAAQLAIRTGVTLDDIQFCQPVFVPSKDPTRKSSKIFRPQAVIQSDRTIFVEAIRQNANWETELMDKLARMEIVCRSRQTNIPVRDPALILVAESTAHMGMLLRMMERKPASFQVYITADPLVYATPEACLYTLKRANFWTSLFAS